MAATLPAPDHEVAVIGAGLSGLGMGAALRRAGIEDFVIFERAAAQRCHISAMGAFGGPNPAEIPGLDDFAGQLIHSARWDHAYDLAGKRVAVVGTGASAVQIIPVIAKQVARLDVYQRTPIW